LKSQEATGTASIGLEQKFIDTAVNEWRKRLFPCLCSVFFLCFFVLCFLCFFSGQILQAILP